MKTTNFALVRYDADEGKVFDWAEPRFEEVPIDETDHSKGMRSEQQHLYVKTVFVGGNDSIENYIEVDEPVEEVADGNSENS